MVVLPVPLAGGLVEVEEPPAAGGAGVEAPGAVVEELPPLESWIRSGREFVVSKVSTYAAGGVDAPPEVRHAVLAAEESVETSCVVMGARKLTAGQDGEGS